MAPHVQSDLTRMIRAHNGIENRGESTCDETTPAQGAAASCTMRSVNYDAVVSVTSPTSLLPCAPRAILADNVPCRQQGGHGPYAVETPTRCAVGLRGFVMLQTI